MSQPTIKTSSSSHLLSQDALWNLPAKEESQHGGPVSALMNALCRQEALKSDPASSYRSRKISVSIYRPVPTRSPFKATTSLIFSSKTIRQYVVTLSDPSDPSRVYARLDSLLFKAIKNLPEQDPLLIHRENVGLDIDKVRVPKRPPVSDILKSQQFMNSVWQKSGSRPTIFGVCKWGWDNNIKPAPFVRGVPKSEKEVYEKLKEITVWGFLEEDFALFADSRDGKRVLLDWTDRVVLMGDSASGAAAALEFGEYLYSNIDYNVILTREPTVSKDWPYLGLNCYTRVSPTGTGVCKTEFFDERGSLGFALQNIIVKIGTKAKI
ncbi:hypothetical protein HDU76_000240 [Blyttiomyces sp. JEL0837]|nr:hypothetical protein HDU76_000240 [Blyttiomyces sp. JEL0837]